MRISLIFAVLTTIWTSTAAHPEPQEQVVELGTKFMFLCPSPMGGNASDLVWMENGAIFVARKGYTLTLHAGADADFVNPTRIRRSTLAIDRVEESNNGTVFSCFGASRSGGTIFGSVRLIVLAHDELPQGFPMLVSPSETKSREWRIPGEWVRLPCYATGNPMPRIAWFKDAIMLDQNDKRYLFDSPHDRSIVNLQPEDSGRYECVAYNIHGRVTSKPFELYVRAERTRTSAMRFGFVRRCDAIAFIMGFLMGMIMAQCLHRLFGKSERTIQARPILLKVRIRNVDTGFDVVVPINETERDASKSESARQFAVKKSDRMVCI